MNLEFDEDDGRRAHNENESKMTRWSRCVSPVMTECFTTKGSSARLYGMGSEITRMCLVAARIQREVLLPLTSFDSLRLCIGHRAANMQLELEAVHYYFSAGNMCFTLVNNGRSNSAIIHNNNNNIAHGRSEHNSRGDSPDLLMFKWQ